MILQHYYTSCVGVSGETGFQVKAMSPGIPPHVTERLMRQVAYRSPLSLDPYDIFSHPVALRYDYVGPQESFLLCSQSSGRDENERPGNFFAHSLILLYEQKLSQVLAPILYWRSPFWRLRDETDQNELPVLPDLESVPLGPPLIERIWPFLTQRRHLLYKLICAVIHSSRAGRRIVIVGQDDEVALWVAAVTCMLPPSYRPLATFSTYTHDPYQSPSLITGTSPDSLFGRSQSEHRTFFILDTERKEVSRVDDSPYAAYVAQCATATSYERDLLSFFVWCEEVCHSVQCIDEGLDHLIGEWHNNLHRVFR